MLKQKAQLHLFQEGDVNSSYFYALIRGRRRRLHIHTIQDEEGNRFDGDDEIATAAYNHFQKILREITSIFRTRKFNVFFTWLQMTKMLIYKVCLLWMS